MQFFAKLADLICLSLVFCLCCLPLVTIGVNCSALYYAIVKSVLPGNGKAIRSFFRGWKQSWRQALPAGSIATVVLGLLTGSFYVISRNDLGFVGSLFGMFFVAFALLCLTLMAFAFPLMGRFQNTMAGVLQNSFLLSMQNIRVTISMVIVEVLLLIGLLCVWIVPIVVLILPGLVLWMQAKMLEPLLEPYVEEQEAQTKSVTAEEEHSIWEELRGIQQENEVK